MKSFRTIISAGFLASALVLAGCGGGGNDAPPETVTPEKTVYEMALEAIQEAETATEAQAAYDAVDQTAVSGEEAGKLMEALTDRQEELATAARITAQKERLATAAANVDTSDLSSPEAIGAARTDIANLQAALDAAVDVSDEDKEMYQSTLNTANSDVEMAQNNLLTQERMTDQRSMIMSAVTEARTAVNAVNDDSTEAEVMAADNAITALKTAIEGADDLPAGDSVVASAEGTLATLENRLGTAKMSRMTAMNKANDVAYMERKALAAKLYAGIYVSAADATGTAVGDVFAAYNEAGTPSGSTADTLISVTTGDGTAAVTAHLSEDKDAMVAALHGWQGKRYHRTTPASGGTYEAVVYSNVGKSTQGDMVGQIGVTTAASGYEYGIHADGYLVDAGGSAFTWDATRIASPDFDQSAGVKEFKLGTNREYVPISGTYHGVSGEYRCEPAASSTCAVQHAGTGFNLGGTADTGNAFTAGGGSWTFFPSDTDARVTDMPDANYVSYGWWLHKAANDGAFTASAFTDVKGSVDDAAAINALNGTASYVGGAAGKYALSSSTGGTNDAGHFTARATLKADFTNNTAQTAISGTIDKFTGEDGETRKWTVKLNGDAIGDTGAIDGLDAASEQVGTVWTIDGNAATAAGQWSGALRNNGDDGVPQVATGTFHSTYGTDGKMVGAFGAGLDDN